MRKDSQKDSDALQTEPNLTVFHVINIYKVRYFETLECWHERFKLKNLSQTWLFYVHVRLILMLTTKARGNRLCGEKRKT